MNALKLSLKLFFVVTLLVAAISCKKETEETTTPTPGTNNPPPAKALWKDTLARKWRVTDATHNSAPDNSSKGLELDIKKDGSYLLISENFTGTWKFTDSTYTKILVDEADPSLKTTWTITTFTSKKLIVDFRSPFTGGKAHWVMSPF